MSNSNPFEIVLVITALILVASGVFAIVAPSLGVDVPTAPKWPSLPNLEVQGNFSSQFPFDETHIVTSKDTTNIFVDGGVKYSAFAPDKAVIFHVKGWFDASDYFTIVRYGWLDWQYQEPIFYANGSQVPNDKLTPQIIVDNYNPVNHTSLFIVDKDNPLYECYAAFTPPTGYSGMDTGWNSVHGFTLRMFGAAYETPDWASQAGAYLVWFGSVLGYFVYFVAYMIQMASTLFTLLGLAPALASGVIVLVMVIFVGSLLMFLRGNSGGSNK